MSKTAIQSYHGSYLMPSLEHATVGEAMHPGIVSVQTATPLTEVARIMVTHHVHCIAVMGIAGDGSGESLVWGMITDLDVIRAAVGNGADQTASDLAQQPIISVKPDVPLRHAAELMLTHHVSHLVVIDPDRLLPIGILSSLDIAGVQAWGEG